MNDGEFVPQSPTVGRIGTEKCIRIYLGFSGRPALGLRHETKGKVYLTKVLAYL